MSRSLRTFLLAALAFGLLLAITYVPTLQAAGTESKSEPKTTAESLYNDGVALAEQGDFAKAREKFQQAYDQDDADPEIVNMLAFTMRKTGDLDGAFAMYEKALSLRDRFPQAREYLGEAHLQAALQQVEILRSYGSDGEQELDSLISALQQAAQEAAGEAAGAETPRKSKGW